MTTKKRPIAKLARITPGEGNKSLLEATRAIRDCRTGPPGEHDLPPAGTFPGPEPKLVSGQIDLDGRVHVPHERAR